jgi:hypothetical protein
MPGDLPYGVTPFLAPPGPSPLDSPPKTNPPDVPFTLKIDPIVDTAAIKDQLCVYSPKIAHAAAKAAVLALFHDCDFKLTRDKKVYATAKFLLFDDRIIEVKLWQEQIAALCFIEVETLQREFRTHPDALKNAFVDAYLGRPFHLTVQRKQVEDTTHINAVSALCKDWAAIYAYFNNFY